MSAEDERVWVVEFQRLQLAAAKAAEAAAEASAAVHAHKSATPPSVRIQQLEQEVEKLKYLNETAVKTRDSGNVIQRELEATNHTLQSRLARETAILNFILELWNLERE